MSIISSLSSNLTQTEAKIEYNSSERIKLGHLLYIGSCKLDYPNTAAAISIIIMHKYYNFMQNKNYNDINNDNIELIASILFLVGKLTENLRSINDVINVTTWLFMVQNNTDIAINSCELSIKDVVVKEHYLLRVLGFDIHFDIPHSYLVQYCNSLLNLNERIIILSWKLLQDSLLSNDCISIIPQVYACSCLLLSIKIFNLNNNINSNLINNNYIKEFQDKMDINQILSETINDYDINFNNLCIKNNILLQDIIISSKIILHNLTIIYYIDVE